MVRGFHCGHCEGDSIFANLSGEMECVECGLVFAVDSKNWRFCDCGGRQSYYRGFDHFGKLLADDVCGGTWECIKCGKRDLQFRDEGQDPSVPLQKTLNLTALKGGF